MSAGGDIFIDIAANTGLAEEQIQSLLNSSKGKKIALNIDKALFAKELADLQKQINNVKLDKLKIDIDKSNYKSELNELEKQLLNLKNNRLEIKADVTSVKSDINNITTTLRDIQNKKIDLDINKNTIELSLAELKSKLYDIQTKKISISAKIESLELSRQPYQAEVTRLSNSVKTLISHAAPSEVIQGFRDDLAIAKKELDSFDAKLIQTKNLFTALDSAGKSIEANIKTAEKPISTIENTKKELNNQEAEYKQQLNIQKNLQDKLKLEQDKTNQSIESQSNKVKEFKLFNGEQIKQDADKAKQALNEIKLEQDKVSQKAKENEANFKYDEAIKSAEDLANAEQNVGEEAKKAGENASTGAKSLSDVLSSISKGLSGASSIVNKIGTTLGSDKLYSGISSAVSSISNLFTGSIGDAVERYDIYTTFPKYMELIGESGEAAVAQLEKMRTTVTGTKIAFTDVVADAQKYAYILGDMNKAVDLALGMNTIYTLGGSDASSTYKSSLQRMLINNESFENNRQVLSIISAMGAGSVFVAKELGIESGNVGELVRGIKAGVSNTKIEEQLKTASAKASATLSAKLQEGAISGEQLIDAIVATQQNGDLKVLTEISKGTLEGAKNALKQSIVTGEADIIKIIDEGLQKNGSSITSEIFKFQNIITDAFNDLGKYIGEHPEIINNFLEGVKTLLNEFSNIVKDLGTKDIAGTIKNIFSSLKEVLSIYGDIANLIGDNSFVWSSIIVWAPLISKGLSALSTVFKIISGFKLAKNISIGAKNIEEAGKAMTPISNGLNNFKSIGQGILLTGGAIALAAELGATIKLYVSTLQDIANLDLGEDFGSKIGRLAGVMAGASVAVGLLITAMSALSASQIGGAVVAVGEILSAGFLALVGLAANAMKDFATAYKTYAEAVQITSEIDPDAISKDKMEKISLAIRNLKEACQGWEAPSNAEDFKNFAEGIKKYIEILPQLQSLDVDANKIKEVTDKFKGSDGIGKSLADLASAIGELNFTYGTGGPVDFSGIEWKTGMISSILIKIQEDYNALTSLNVPDVDVGDDSMLAKAINNIGTIKQKISLLGDPEIGKSGLVDLATVEWNIGMVASSLYKFQNVQSALNGIQTVDAGKVSSITDGIKSIMNDLQDAFGENGAWALEAKAGTLLSAVYKIQNLLTATTTIGAGGGGNLSSITGGVTELGNASSEAEGKVNALGGAIVILPTEHKTDIIVNTESASAAIKAIQAEINGITGTTVSVNVNENRTTTEESVSREDGGFVPQYRDKGGYVRFVPRGTDTVPAMLTPGEYVIRRGVASVLGKSTLDKLNSMDIQGAMASLGMASIYKTYHTTNTYNNDNRSTTVIQNINNNSEEYSYARAGKFVERLGRL